MRKRSMTVEQALAFCVERRPIVNPNEGERPPLLALALGQTDRSSSAPSPAVFLPSPAVLPPGVSPEHRCG
eukprot:scaffold7658_cov90-Isochrysis_galbana.AAC.1